jgi:hypothetical protein
LEADVASVTDQVFVRNFLPFQWLVDESQYELSFSFVNYVNIEEVDGGSECRDGSKGEQDFGIVKWRFEGNRVLFKGDDIGVGIGVGGSEIMEGKKPVLDTLKLKLSGALSTESVDRNQE